MPAPSYNSIDLPPGWEGSKPEYLCYQTLIQLGKEPNKDFTYQSPLQGGRMEKGGMVIDFSFNNPPDLAINVQGVYYHYEFGVETRARDLIARAQLAGHGVSLVFIDDDDLIRNPRWHIEEALRYRDHSRIGALGG
jgi:hypothetical protein